jgi:hypothetical protein
LVNDFIALAALNDQISAFQDGKMAGNRGAGDWKPGGDFAGGQFAFLEFLQDLPSGRVR